jgi:hypothetical protein
VDPRAGLNVVKRQISSPCRESNAGLQPVAHRYTGRIHRPSVGTQCLHLQGRLGFSPIGPLRALFQAYNTLGIFLARLHLMLLASSRSLACITVQPRRWRQWVNPKRQQTCTRLHGVTSQKTLLFIRPAYVFPYTLSA